MPSSSFRSTMTNVSIGGDDDGVANDSVRDTIMLATSISVALNVDEVEQEHGHYAHHQHDDEYLLYRGLSSGEKVQYYSTHVGLLLQLGIIMIVMTLLLLFSVITVAAKTED